MPFAVDYLILVFIASLGVIQLAGLKNDLKGLYLLKYPKLNLILGLVLFVSPFVWFFLTEFRNVSDTDGGLNGNQQAFLFVFGSLGAVIFTLFITSLFGIRKKWEEPLTISGLETLRQFNYLHVIRWTLGRLWKK